MIRRALASLVILAAVAGLAGCSGATVSLQPAGNANDPACADVMVRLPSSVDGEKRRWTDAQATAAWGGQASVLLTCGLETPAPTTLPCATVSGVDWIIDDSETPYARFTTYGRTPAIEVYLDNDSVEPVQVLGDLALTIGEFLPKTGACTESENYNF